MFSDLMKIAKFLGTILIFNLLFMLIVGGLILYQSYQLRKLVESHVELLVMGNKIIEQGGNKIVVEGKEFNWRENNEKK